LFDEATIRPIDLDLTLTQGFERGSPVDHGWARD